MALRSVRQNGDIKGTTAPQLPQAQPTAPPRIKEAARDAFFVNGYELKEAPRTLTITRENGKKESIELPGIVIRAKFNDENIISAASFPSGSSKEFGGFYTSPAGTGSSGKENAANFQIEENLSLFCDRVKYEASRLMLEGDFGAAKELLSQASGILHFVSERASWQLGENGWQVFKAIEGKIGSAGKDLVSLGAVSALVLSTYSKDQQLPSSISDSYSKIPKESIIKSLGEEAYKNIGIYLQNYAQALARDPYAYSTISTQENKEYFSAIEKGLAEIRVDIVLAKGASQSELAEIARKWGIASESRFEVVGRLVARYSTGTAYYESTSLLDMDRQGLDNALAKNPEFSKLSPDEQARNKIACNARIESAKEGFKEQAKPFLNYAMCAGEKASDYTLLTDPRRLGLVQALSNVSPEAKLWNAFDKNTFSPFAGEVSLLRNLSDISKLESSFRQGETERLLKGTKLELSGSIEGLSVEAFKTSSKSGDLVQIEISEPRMAREQFQKELAGRYASLSREIQTSDSWKAIEASMANPNATFDDVAGSMGTLFENYGRTGLLLASVVLNMSKHPLAKAVSETFMIGLSAWDAYDGNYLGAATLLVGMYGSAIPGIGKGLQTFAVAKMTYDGAVGAVGAISSMKKYGATANEAFDAANAVLVGLLLPTYHGFARAEQMKKAVEFARNLEVDGPESVFAYGIKNTSAGTRGNVPQETISPEKLSEAQSAYSQQAEKITLSAYDYVEMRFTELTGKGVPENRSAGRNKSDLSKTSQDWQTIDVLKKADEIINTLSPGQKRDFFETLYFLDPTWTFKIQDGLGKSGEVHMAEALCRIVALEEARPGAFKELYLKRGINNFSRYSLENLVREFDSLGGRREWTLQHHQKASALRPSMEINGFKPGKEAMQNILKLEEGHATNFDNGDAVYTVERVGSQLKIYKAVVVVFAPVLENTGVTESLQPYIQELSKKFNVQIIEAGTAAEQAKRLISISNEQGKICTALIAGHGYIDQTGGKPDYWIDLGKEKLHLSDFLERGTGGLARYGTDKLSVVLISCEQGAPDAFAQAASKQFPNATIKSPEKPDKVKKLEYAGINKDGTVAFNVEWGKSGATYRDGANTEPGAENARERLKRPDQGDKISMVRSDSDRTVTFSLSVEGPAQNAPFGQVKRTADGWMYSSISEEGTLIYTKDAAGKPACIFLDRDSGEIRLSHSDVLQFGKDGPFCTFDNGRFLEVDYYGPKPAPISKSEMTWNASAEPEKGNPKVKKIPVNESFSDEPKQVQKIGDVKAKTGGKTPYEVVDENYPAKKGEETVTVHMDKTAWDRLTPYEQQARVNNELGNSYWWMNDFYSSRAPVEKITFTTESGNKIELYNYMRKLTPSEVESLKKAISFADSINGGENIRGMQYIVLTGSVKPNSLIRGEYENGYGSIIRRWDGSDGILLHAPTFESGNFNGVDLPSTFHGLDVPKAEASALHEMGHHAWRYNGFDKEWNSLSGWKSDGSINPKTRGYTWVHSETAKFVTEYAKTNAQEDFCDSFMAWKFGLSTLPPEKADFFNRHFGKAQAASEKVSSTTVDGPKVTMPATPIIKVKINENTGVRAAKEPEAKPGVKLKPVNAQTTSVEPAQVKTGGGAAGQATMLEQANEHAGKSKGYKQSAQAADGNQEKIRLYGLAIEESEMAQRLYLDAGEAQRALGAKSSAENLAKAIAKLESAPAEKPVARFEFADLNGVSLERLGEIDQPLNEVYGHLNRIAFKEPVRPPLDSDPGVWGHFLKHAMKCEYEVYSEISGADDPVRHVSESDLKRIPSQSKLAVNLFVKEKYAGKSDQEVQEAVSRINSFIESEVEPINSRQQSTQTELEAIKNKALSDPIIRQFSDFYVERSENLLSSALNGNPDLRCFLVMINGKPALDVYRPFFENGKQYMETGFFEISEQGGKFSFTSYHTRETNDPSPTPTAVEVHFEKNADGSFGLVANKDGVIADGLGKGKQRLFKLVQ